MGRSEDRAKSKYLVQRRWRRPGSSVENEFYNTMPVYGRSTDGLVNSVLFRMLKLDLVASGVTVEQFVGGLYGEDNDPSK